LLSLEFPHFLFFYSEICATLDALFPHRRGHGFHSNSKYDQSCDYLFIRLRQLGIQSGFVVPGDYNLRLLDFVEPSGLHWVGNCNELNAAYAADRHALLNGLMLL
jgi:hypothetical protein